MYGLITKICDCVFARDPGKHNEFIVNVDQSYAESFNINEAGWIRNDISAFEMAGSESERLLFLDRLNEIKFDDQYKDLTDDEMLRFAMPRRALSDPVEYSRFVSSLAHYEYDKKKAAYDEEQDKNAAEEAAKKAAQETSVKVDGVVQTASPSTANA